MKNLKKISIVTFSIAMMAGTSCKKSKVPQPVPVQPIKEEKPVDPEVPKVFIPVKITSGNTTLELKYVEKTGLIRELKSSEGATFSMSYDKGQLVKLERIQNGSNPFFVQYLIKDAKIYRATQFSSQGNNSVPADKYYFEYDASGQIINIKRHGVDNKLSAEYNFSYNAKGTLEETTIIKNNEITTYSSTNDTQNGIFKHVKFIQIVAIEIGLPVLIAGPHNPLSYTCPTKPATNKNYSYTYNELSYPSQQQISTNGVSQTFNITYAELK